MLRWMDGQKKGLKIVGWIDVGWMDRCWMDG